MTATHVAQTSQTAQTAATGPLMTRREFLYYIWAASMSFFMIQTGGAILWFAYPRFKAGEFGGLFRIELDKIPLPDSPDPLSYPEGRFWLVNAGEKIANDPPRHTGWM